MTKPVLTEIEHHLGITQDDIEDNSYEVEYGSGVPIRGKWNGAAWEYEIHGIDFPSDRVWRFLNDFGEWQAFAAECFYEIPLRSFEEELKKHGNLSEKTKVQVSEFIDEYVHDLSDHESKQQWWSMQEKLQANTALPAEILTFVQLAQTKTFSILGHF